MEVPADVGQVVAAGQTVVRLAHDGMREAVINLPEGTQAQAEDSATAFLYADPGAVFSAKLRELSAMADPVTRTYQARYTLGEAGKVAPLGATVTVILEAKQSDASGDPEVPIGALYDNGSGTGVWVIDEITSTVTLRQVKVTHLGEETASVSGELQPGERIVALGAHLLKPAEKIRLAAATREEDVQ
jgi:RND family efflux transporter MFP subunit